MLIFVFLFLYWSNSSFFCFVTPTCFSLFSFCWSKYPVFQLFPPIQLASSFCPLEQIFCFSAFSPNPACFFFLPVGANILFFNFLPQSSLLLLSARWSKYSIFQLFPQYSLLLPSSCWSKYSVFLLFPQTQLASLFFPLEQISCFSTFCPNPACFFFLPVGANILFFSFFPQYSLLLSSSRWSKCTVFYLFAPIQSQSCLNPASTKLQINPRLHSDHPRSGLTSASSVYRWIHTSQVQIVQIQLPHL